jgi:hypothetical protein
VEGEEDKGRKGIGIGIKFNRDSEIKEKIFGAQGKQSGMNYRVQLTLSPWFNKEIQK